MPEECQRGVMVTEAMVSRADSTSVSPQPSGESPRPSDDSPDPGPGPDKAPGSDTGSGAGPSAADGGALSTMFDLLACSVARHAPLAGVLCA